MNPSPRAPLIAMHLSVECLTIGLTKMSRQEETTPRMEIATGQSVESLIPSGASRAPRALDPEQDQVHLSQDTHVRSMVQVPTKAEAFAHSDPSLGALREKIKGDY